MAAPATTPQIIPPLESGDQLTRAEFERRYDAMPNLKKAELIEGVVFVPSPVRWNQHGGPHSSIITWLGVYRANTPGVQVGDNGTVRLDPDNEPQPDVAMILQPAYGGQSRLSPDDYVEGAPELVAEVAASTASIALNKKLRVYERNGVREYIVWRVLDQAVDWFVLRRGKYDRLAPGPAGFHQSEVFPGLWLDTSALIQSELARVLQVLSQGIASPEHASFVARLQRIASGKP